MPCSGTIENLHLPGGKDIRVDSMLYQGYQVPPFYDSMLAKVIVHGENRDEAIQKMKSTLGELIIEGITTNLDFQYELIGMDEYAQGNSAAINRMLEERCKG